jgi:polyisoprenyl-phosphate glycosyltransferase
MNGNLQRSHISVVSPVYGAEHSVELLVDRLVKNLSSITQNFEIILVEDASPDNSWVKIEEIALKEPRVKGLKLSRNFGQHTAITAGLDYANGDWVVVMDCDLQDRPEEIRALYEKAQEGYDVVQARRHQRQDKLGKRAVSWMFSKTLSYLTGVKYDYTIANFGIYHHKVVEAIRQMRESIRFFPTMVRWVGFRQTSLNVEHAEREIGHSSYNLKKLFNLALDIILSYSDKPIRLMVKLGVYTALAAFLYAIYVVLQAIRGDIQVMGYASIFASIWFFSGVMILFLGIIGLYIGKTFEGVKNRPIYILSKKTEVTQRQGLESKKLTV